MTIPTIHTLLEKFDIHKEAKALYLKGWEEHPSPDGKRMAYGRTFKVGPVDVAVRIIQDNNEGTAWRVDRKGLPTWEAMFQGQAFKSEAAAGQAVAGWWERLQKAYASAQKDGYAPKDAASRALGQGERSEGAQQASLRVLLEKLEQRDNSTFVFTGAGARLTIGYHGESYRLEELPVKGKRQLRVAELGTGYRGGQMARAWDAMLPQNILHFAKLADSDGFDAIKDKVGKAVAEAQGAVIAQWEGAHRPDWLQQQGSWREQAVPAGRVAPEGGDTELVVDGKDFALKVTWKTFRAYSPNSDFQQASPYYTGTVEKGPSAAAKLFKLLQAQPAALKGVAYKDLGAWLDDHKIARKGTSSTWS